MRRSGNRRNVEFHLARTIHNRCARRFQIEQAERIGSAAHPVVMIARFMARPALQFVSLAFVAICSFAQAGCSGSGEKANGARVNASTDTRATSDSAYVPAPRDRELPRSNARQAAQQVSLMGPVGDARARAKIDLIAAAFRAAIESGDGGERYFVLVAGSGVSLETDTIDTHECALRILAPLGTLSESIAWAPAEVQRRVRVRHASGDRSAPVDPVAFPGTRHPAAIVTLTLDAAASDGVQRGTITIESPDGRAARQGLEARRDGTGGVTVRLTGVRVKW